MVTAGRAPSGLIADELSRVGCACHKQSRIREREENARRHQPAKVIFRDYWYAVTAVKSVHWSFSFGAAIAAGAHADAQHAAGHRRQMRAWLISQAGAIADADADDEHYEYTGYGT
jgi:hypothetical protein